MFNWPYDQKHRVILFGGVVSMGEYIRVSMTVEKHIDTDLVTAVQYDSLALCIGRHEHTQARIQDTYFVRKKF